MKWTLLIMLFIAGATSVSAQQGCPRVHRISPTFNETQRKITSPRDLMFGHLIGLSKAEVADCQGEPSVKETNAWTYRESLGPGAHSFRYHWLVKFRRDKVVEVEVIREAVGCILIPPPREWLSKR